MTRGRARLRSAARKSGLGAVVLDADQRQSLVTIRALGDAGIRVGALENRASAPAFRSRWCVASGLVPNYADDSAAFVDAVLDWTQGHRMPALIPSNDGSIAALRHRRADVERDTRLALASESALDVATSKERTLARAAELGIRIPRTVAVTDVSDVGSAAEELGFPLVVKPTESWVSFGPRGTRLTSRVVVTRDEAAREVESMHELGSQVIMQEWLSGNREAVSLFRAQGRIWARFAQLATRMHPPLGGCSVARVSIPLPSDITAASELLVDAIDLDGYSEIEFRRDAEGRPALMEINPRLSASLEIAVRAGVNFPLLLYSWAVGDALRTNPGYRVGLRMRWLGGDLLWLRETLKTQGRPDVEPTFRALRLFFGDFLRPARYDYLAIRDLLPAVVASATFLRHSVARLVKRSRRDGES